MFGNVANNRIPNGSLWEFIMDVHLPDGSRRELPAGSSAVDLARKLKKQLQGIALAAEINGNLQDIATPLQSGDTVRLITFHDQEGKELFWHSSAHLLAHAVMRLFPDAKPTIGPPIENGFYYDFADLHISESDFPQVEEEMRKIAAERIVPERVEYGSKEEALRIFAGNRYKREMIDQLEEGLSAYRHDDFIDLCRGPHVPHMGLIRAFKITKTSGAYWRADAEGDRLTRIYGISFPDRKMLSSHLKFLEEAERRDHRILGKRQKLFSFHPEAPGMPFFHPDGMIVWDELVRYWLECHQEAGYRTIKTPIMLSRELWQRSGHWDNYRENMYLSQVDDRAYAIKPMNCPGGMLYFKEDQYSYRQLPLRIGEIGLVHRHELSGTLSGLFRVRCFHQDDAHIYMTPEQIKTEIRNVLELSGKIYSQFDLDYRLELSTKPEKAIGTDEEWEIATKGLQDALDEGGFGYEGDGAFYGPKIDLHIQDAIGRTWQCGTIQLDMQLPERFDLAYVTSAGEKRRPIMIHRTIYGSFERFFGVLTEHFAGKFPMWLSPKQVRILAITDRHSAYAREICRRFSEEGLRAETDWTTESVNKKVRSAQLDQVNYILVVGDREIEEKTVTVRADNKVLGAYKIQDVIDSLKREFQTRTKRKNRID